MSNASHYTQPDSSDVKTVKVAEFRQRIESVEQYCHCDYHACVTDAERLRWADMTARAAAELSGMACARATKQDMDRRERALDKSATLIIKVRGQ